MLSRERDDGREEYGAYSCFTTPEDARAWAALPCGPLRPETEPDHDCSGWYWVVTWWGDTRDDVLRHKPRTR